MVSGKQGNLCTDRIESGLDKGRRGKQLLVMIQYRIHKLFRIGQTSQARSRQDRIDRSRCVFKTLQPGCHPHTNHTAHPAAKRGIGDQELVVRFFQHVTIVCPFKRGCCLIYINRFLKHNLFIVFPEKQGSVVPSKTKRVRQYRTQGYSFLITGNRD